jgi:hypothetical protein
MASLTLLVIGFEQCSFSSSSCWFFQILPIPKEQVLVQPSVFPQSTRIPSFLDVAEVFYLVLWSPFTLPHLFPSVRLKTNTSKVVVHIHIGILFSHKNECIWLSSSEVDEPRTYYTEWSRSDRERKLSYINAYIWNLERWYWWSNLQGSKRDTDILDTAGRRGWDDLRK